MLLRHTPDPTPWWRQPGSWKLMVWLAVLFGGLIVLRLLPYLLDT